MLHLVVVSPKKKEKEKEKKRNINNDLAILPSHDTSLLSFLVLPPTSMVRFSPPVSSYFHYTAASR